MPVGPSCITWSCCALRTYFLAEGKYEGPPKCRKHRGQQLKLRDHSRGLSMLCSTVLGCWCLCPLQMVASGCYKPQAFECLHAPSPVRLCSKQRFLLIRLAAKGKAVTVMPMQAGRCRGGRKTCRELLCMSLHGFLVFCSACRVCAV